ncbi:MAG: hypothetical protein KatS3mg023_3672 [Armatimonadota bacterium]|nr:MAG: hypothetical protein KatS3mg023_3672 [Armatimonadota bacterium]
MRVTLAISRELFMLGLPGRQVAVPISGDRDSQLANAILALPRLMQQLVAAGMTELALVGPAQPGQVPASVWAIEVPKGDAELEQARQQAISILQQANVSLVGAMQVLSIDQLADFLKPQQDAQPQASRRRGAFA